MNFAGIILLLGVFGLVYFYLLRLRRSGKNSTNPPPLPLSFHLAHGSAILGILMFGSSSVALGDVLWGNASSVNGNFFGMALLYFCFALTTILALSSLYTLIRNPVAFRFTQQGIEWNSGCVSWSNITSVSWGVSPGSKLPSSLDIYYQENEEKKMYQLPGIVREANLSTLETWARSYHERHR